LSFAALAAGFVPVTAQPFFDATAPVGASAASNRVLDARLAEAQARFQAGKRLLQEGNREGARLAFDQSIHSLLTAPLALEDRLRLERRLEDLIDLVYQYDIDELGAGGEKSFDRSPLDEIRELTFPIDPTLKGLVQHQIAATASELPMVLNDSVLSFVNYFSQGRGRYTLINGWRRSHRYRPMIERILAEEGVPAELIFLAQAESGFLPRAVSRKAATGMWQFVAFRGKEYGLTQTPLVDLRLDPEQATRAAARHLRDLYMQFGDWQLAIAAYNCGPGCVGRAVERTGYADYWQLRGRNALPKETTNYVPIITALTIVTKNAAAYGITLDDPDPALEYDTVKLEANTRVELIADAADLPVSAIRELNPALLKGVAPAGYELRLPKGQAPPIVAAIRAVPGPQRSAWRLHRVRSGDTLPQIAQQYRTTAKSILAANGEVSGEMGEGQVLMIPASYVEPPARAVRSVSRKTQAARPAAQSARGKAPAKAAPGSRSGARATGKKTGPRFTTARQRAAR
jgi:membrane-bound lytic murein transglycosylase D